MIDCNNKRVLLGLSAGINSAAVYCWLLESGMKPSELHLFYAHFTEHSPDSFQFVADTIRHARRNFDNVIVKVTRNSVLEFFDDKKMIPHPRYSPCSSILKIEPMARYASEHCIDIDLIGYVRTEKKRIQSMYQHHGNDMFLQKGTPIAQFDDEWCFEIAKKHIGWYPAIYDIRDENGKRVFHHNNCLPCKNMYVKDMQNVQRYYPDYWQRANNLSIKLQSHWGRNADEYYTTFGREDWEPGQCETCKFD